MEIVLNGRSLQLPEEIKTVQQLLEYLTLSERVVIVEVNREITPKEAYQRELQELDEVEMIHFVGGG
ncbi:sulfur carrier protein ThiS [Lederbergia galactosidilytica]|uniref:Thiamine biosynthesis protein ThiS n=1 Tax=Lederbergia galactosidilytica TaxID=217031 RepID=A0A177ZKM3_9BACI|nr:sulfur carrier protein ThiS [Lederbergia galactosidilytica]KRG13804.1 thiamine biosynthesis protein ThiS [Virgibacillus soli]MBP1916961.1 sulfur carrier protein [Lederbergia galactosidilytica]OAK67438.1 thiamine biosynthesis protein ThiS [Lederbergia galactosidilytica]